MTEPGRFFNPLLCQRGFPLRIKNCPGQKERPGNERTEKEVPENKMKRLLAGILALALLLCGASALAEKTLTKNEARALALKYAGLDKDDPVVFTMEEKDYENGRLYYGFAFHCRGFQYELDIDAQTGAFRDFGVRRYMPDDC